MISKISKILIFVLLILFVGFGFSRAQDNESAQGTVYVCPNATSLEEINPRCPDKIILKLGETVNGMTLTTTAYEDKEYYFVPGFTNGGGGVNLPPVANVNGPYEGYEGSPITFDASNSTDPNNDSLQYRWDFNNDGAWATDWLDTPTTTYTFGDDFKGEVKLEISDGEFTGSATTEVTVSNVAPVAKMDSVVQPDSHFILPGQKLIFNGSFTDPGWLDTHTATWDFGDETIIAGTLTEENEKPDATGKIIDEHSYSKAGVYTVILTVKDDDGGTGTFTVQVKVMTAEEAVGILNNYIQNLPNEAFKNNPENRKGAFNNKLLEVIAKIKNQKYQDAINKLQKDIRSKADGDKTAEDWIINFGAQKEICKMIDDIVKYLEILNIRVTNNPLAIKLAVNGPKISASLLMSAVGDINNSWSRSSSFAIIIFVGLSGILICGFILILWVISELFVRAIFKLFPNIKKSDSKKEAIISLILGIVSIIPALQAVKLYLYSRTSPIGEFQGITLYIIGILIAAVGFVFGKIGLKSTKKNLAIMGIILCTATFLPILCLLGLILTISFCR